MYQKPSTTYTGKSKNKPYLSNKRCISLTLNKDPNINVALVRCSNRSINGLDICPLHFSHIYDLKAKI